MDKTINIITYILFRDYYNLENSFRRVLKSIGSYTFNYDKIDPVKMINHDGIEYIINGFYHDDSGNIVLNVTDKETYEEVILNIWNYDNIVVFQNILTNIAISEFPEED